MLRTSEHLLSGLPSLAEPSLIIPVRRTVRVAIKYHLDVACGRHQKRKGYRICRQSECVAARQASGSRPSSESLADDRGISLKT